MKRVIITALIATLTTAGIWGAARGEIAFGAEMLIPLGAILWAVYREETKA